MRRNELQGQLRCVQAVSRGLDQRPPVRDYERLLQEVDSSAFLGAFDDRTAEQTLALCKLLAQYRDTELHDRRYLSDTKIALVQLRRKIVEVVSLCWK